MKRETILQRRDGVVGGDQELLTTFKSLVQWSSGPSVNTPRHPGSHKFARTVKLHHDLLLPAIHPSLPPPFSRRIHPTSGKFSSSDNFPESKYRI